MSKINLLRRFSRSANLEQTMDDLNSTN